MSEQEILKQKTIYLIDYGKHWSDKNICVFKAEKLGDNKWRIFHLYKEHDWNPFLKESSDADILIWVARSQVLLECPQN